MLVMNCDGERLEDLLPKEPIIGKRRRAKSKTSKKKVDDGKEQKKITPAMQSFKTANPFANPKEFVAFYRSIVRSYTDRRVEFPTHGADREYASVVMDELIDIGREKDIEFLREWIKYFAEFKLKEDDFEDYRKTGVRQFNKSLDEYNKRHIDIDS